jgi:hypothetical protein
MSLQGRRERRKGKRGKRCMPDDEGDCNLRRVLCGDLWSFLKNF